MSDTKFEDNSWKNDKRVVPRQGADALFAGNDTVVDGNRATRRKAVLNRFIPERIKAAKHARFDNESIYKRWCYARGRDVARRPRAQEQRSGGHEVVHVRKVN